MRHVSLLFALAALPFPARAGFQFNSSRNMAVYWGQNSFAQSSGSASQQRLSYYCSNPDIDIIPLAFLDGISPLSLNLANAANKCSPFPDNPQLLQCPQVEQDIITCQQVYGKTILLSIGGATYSQGGFQTTEEASNAAHAVWGMFGPVSPNSSGSRPFGSAVVDGFDFDLESPVSNMPVFGSELRRLMDRDTAAGGKRFYLSAAPQCPFPDVFNQELLGVVGFDVVMIQFYNNYCGVDSFAPGSATQTSFNFDVWDNWARNSSPKSNTKVMIGIPAAPGAASRGFVEGAQLKEVIRFSRRFPSFGGVMMWDMSQLYSKTGFLEEINTDLNT
ncbi:glycoside hydrolase superfamily [Dactylonectria estremocensis]|uniref:chitinase n=1 Tax=Dactylonectria estremocensis TaxID=1079267 RepID=A0A9P9IFL8_9HYPO|nr:glycoside hydrolase superfamily [Dactylonectria estremocensis]